MAYQLFMGYSILKFDSLVNVNCNHNYLVYLSNGISIPYGLFNVEI